MQENKISNFFDFFIEYCIILSCKKQQFLIFLYFYITITKIKKQQNSKTVDSVNLLSDKIGEITP